MRGYMQPVVKYLCVVRCIFTGLLTHAVPFQNFKFYSSRIRMIFQNVGQTLRISGKHISGKHLRLRL